MSAVRGPVLRGASLVRARRQKMMPANVGETVREDGIVGWSQHGLHHRLIRGFTRGLLALGGGHSILVQKAAEKLGAATGPRGLLSGTGPALGATLRRKRPKI